MSVRPLFLFVFAVPALAQTAFTVTPLNPEVTSVTHGAIGAPFFTETHTSTPGVLDLQVVTNNNVTGAGRVTAQAPASLSGTIDGQVLRLTPSGNFTLNAAISNARLTRWSTSSLDGVRQVEAATQSLTLERMTVDAATLTASISTTLAFRLPITPNSEFNTSEIRYAVTFRWRLAPVCPSASIVSARRAADEFCPVESDLAISHIEIVQSIQQWITDNQLLVVPLVPAREARVRVFVRRGTEGDGDLSGIRGEVLLENSIRLKPAPPPEQPVTAPDGLPDTRSRANSLDFILTDLQMRREGPLTLRAEVWLVDDQGKRIEDTRNANNSRTITINIGRTTFPEVFDIGIANVCMSGRGCPASFAKTPLHLAAWFPSVQTRVFPVHFPRLTLDASLMENADRMFATIANLYFEYLKARHLSTLNPLLIQPAADQLVFNVFGGPTDNSADTFFGVPGGLSNAWLIRSQSFFAGAVQTQIAHGIGHNLGLTHYALSSPVDQVRRDDYPPNGWDILLEGFQNPVPDAPHVEITRVSNSLMDYRKLPDAWVSPGEFDLFFQNAPKQPATAAAAETLVIPGSVSGDGQTGALQTGFRMQSNVPAPASNPDGDTCIRFLNGTSQVGNFCFALAAPTGLANRPFAVAAPFPQGANRVALLYRGRELAALSAGTPPSVTILSPVGGETWQGTQTVRWTPAASGTQYTVLYSPDDGATWLPLSPTLTASEYTLNTADLIAGERVRFRVLASSGLDTAAATSAAVRVPSGPPMTLSSRELQFSNLTVGESEYLELTVTNPASGQAWATIEPPDNAAFSTDDAVSPILGPAEATTVRIRFKPSAAGPQQGTIRIGGQTVTLRGAAFTAATPSIQAPSQVDLGHVEAGKDKDVTVRIANTGGAALTVNTIAVSGAGFSVATPVPFTVEPGASANVIVRLQRPAAGAQTGQLTIGSSDPTRPQLTATISALSVSGVVPSTSAAAVVNAASFKGGSIAPGEIVTIFGAGMGPSQLAQMTLDSQGKVPIELNGVRVLFDGVAAPLIYAQAGQAALVVPYSVAGASTTQMVVEYQGRKSDPVTLNVAAAAPGLFSANSSGSGPGAIFNQDASVNSAANPAQPGSVVVLFGTGEGETDPFGVDGMVAASVYPKPLQPVRVTIGGLDARVLYAGAAPNLVAGVLQVNAEVPAGIAGGPQPVVVTVGSHSSQPGLTVAIAGAGPPPVPSIQVTPASLDFGTVTVGQTRDLALTVRNTGTAPLTLTFLTTTNARFTPSGFSLPISIAAGASQNLTFRFTPTAAGPQTGSIVLSNNDPARPSVTVNVAGTGAAVQNPSIAVEPTTLDFGTVTIGQTRDLTLTIRNTGTAALNVNSILSSNARFTATNAGTFALAAGASRAVTVRFAPTAAGAQTASLAIASNDPARPVVTVGASGTGVSTAAAPIIEISPVSLDFGAVDAGQTKDLPVTVRNTGTATLTVTFISSSNARFAAASPSAPFNVGPGSFQNVVIRFSPTSAGAQTAAINLVSNDPVRPAVTLNVSGTGVGGAAGRAAITSIIGFPNNRTSNQQPALAIDGNIDTYTWTTESFNSAHPSYLMAGFSGPAFISRLRLFKDNNAGGPGTPFKNLTIEYTTSDPSVPLASRTWTRVTGLTNGYNGTELLTALSVNTDGTVTSDSHESLLSGWASLTFNTVNATGIRIGFAYPPNPATSNHYRVYELEVY